MRWPWSSPSSTTDPDNTSNSPTSRNSLPPDLTKSLPSLPQNEPQKPHSTTNYSTLLTSSPWAPDWSTLSEPRNLIPILLLSGSVIGLYGFWKSYLRRIPGTDNISPGFFRRRSLFGKVTSVGDGDNFRLFHTPGGRIAGWGWLRKIPSAQRGKKGEGPKTIPIRLAGIDAPELPHFGKPAQPHAHESHAWLTQYLLRRRVRCYIYKRDQYARVVATVYVRRGLLRRDVGLEMLKRGLATVYGAKTGAEFGSLEERYRAVEAKARKKGLGLWRDEKGWFGRGAVETPAEFKRRVGKEKGDGE